MTQVTAPVDAETLRWAREEAGYASIDSAVQAISCLRNRAKGHDDLRSWEQGDKKPSVAVAEYLAKAYGVSKPLLYVPLEIAKSNVEDVRGINDFRRSEDKGLTPNTIRFLRDVMRRQKWLREILNDTRPIVWQGSFTGRKTKDISDWLIGKLQADTKKDVVLSAVIEKIEHKLGIFVMQSRPSSHHYKVESSFSGCALHDEYVPVVALNAADTQARRLFTLVHEIAHLAIGESGISKVELRLEDDNFSEIERFCNDVATQTLMPEARFLSVWKKALAEPESKNVFPKVAKKFGVSLSACVVRAAQLGQMEYSEAGRWLNLFERSFKQARAKTDKPVVISQSLMARDRAGPTMTKYALQAYDEGRISSMDLYDIFGVKLNHLPSIATRVGHNLVRWQGAQTAIS